MIYPRQCTYTTYTGKCPKPQTRSYWMYIDGAPYEVPRCDLHPKPAFSYASPDEATARAVTDVLSV